jgi:hypothetical protein
MIDFPNNPTVGQTFTAAGVTWIWGGVKWLPSGLSPTVVPGINDNRLINGDMRIDQRNNGASGTAAGVYTIDRWVFSGSQANKGTWGRNISAIVSAVGFPYYLGFGSASAYASVAADVFVFQQAIEADMISDFAWGTTSAQPVTLSFWAQSTLTGTFGGSIRNFAGTRSYPFSFSLPTANAWTKIVLTVPGDTAGTWVMSGNAASMWLAFDLGSGSTYRGLANAWAAANYVGVTGTVSVVATNGAAFFVTGVKLEIGSVATPYNRQSLAKSMADCQRYYQTGFSGMNIGGIASQSFGSIQMLPVAMRAAPTVVYGTPSSGNTTGSPSNNTSAFNSIWTVMTATAAGYAWFNVTWTASAEL